MSKVNVFVSFDIEHDGDLYELLRGQSQSPRSTFWVSGGSKRSTADDVWGEKLRLKIREADQVIVICGEHAEASLTIGAELRMTLEEGTPYFLLWGRREIMCTKPIGSKTSEGIFSWTQPILHDQIALALRSARADATAKSLRNPDRKNAPTSPGVGSS